jgi:hypothetical protein
MSGVWRGRSDRASKDERGAILGVYVCMLVGWKYSFRKGVRRSFEPEYGNEVMYCAVSRRLCHLATGISMSMSVSMYIHQHGN